MSPEKDQPDKETLQFKAKSLELRNRSRVLRFQHEHILSSIKKEDSFTLSEEKFLELQRNLSALGVTNSDGLWLAALFDSGIKDPKLLMEIWNKKDELSQKIHDGASVDDIF